MDTPAMQSWWAAKRTQETSRAHQSVRKRSTQVAKLSQDGGVSSQVPELEESSPQSKTAKKGMSVSQLLMTTSREVLPLWLFVLALASGIFAWWLLWKVLPLWLFVLVLMLAPLAVAITWYEHMHNRVSWDVVMQVVLRVLLLVVAMVVVGIVDSMLSFGWLEALLVVTAAVLLLTSLDWFVDFWCTGMHKRESRLAKWGPHDWVLDSGAGIHRTTNPLVVVFEGDCQQRQEIANQRVWLRLGSVRTERFQFPGVHYVAGEDDDARNVVSVSQLARDHGLVTVFEPTSCHVKDKKTGRTVGMVFRRRESKQWRYGGGGGRGNNGEQGGGTAEGGPSSWGSRGGGTGACSNQEQGGNGSEAARGDINDEEIVNEQEEVGSSENEIQDQEMNDENVDEDDNGKNHQEMNGNVEDDDRKGGRSTFGESSNKGLPVLSRFGFLLCLCIAAFILLLQCTNRRTGVTIFILGMSSLRTLIFVLGLPSSTTLSMMQSRSRKLVKQIGSLFLLRSRAGTSGDYAQESPQEQNRRLFGLSRFDVRITGPAGHHLPAGAFPTSTNAERWEEFLVDSGASFHATWKGSILFPYRPDLQNHYKPPITSFQGIAGSVNVTKSGYLNGNRIMLDGVLLAPESRMNLVSVGQLSIQYGPLQVEMDDMGVVIRNKQDGVQIGGGRMLNNHLYVLEEFRPPKDIFAHLREPQPNIFGNGRLPGAAQ